MGSNSVMLLSPDLQCVWELGTKKEYCMCPEGVIMYPTGKNEDYL